MGCMAAEASSQGRFFPFLVSPPHKASLGSSARFYSLADKEWVGREKHPGRGLEQRPCLYRWKCCCCWLTGGPRLWLLFSLEPPFMDRPSITQLRLKSYFQPVALWLEWNQPGWGPVQARWYPLLPFLMSAGQNNKGIYYQVLFGAWGSTSTHGGLCLYYCNPVRVGGFSGGYLGTQPLNGPWVGIWLVTWMRHIWVMWMGAW